MAEREGSQVSEKANIVERIVSDRLSNKGRRQAHDDFFVGRWPALHALCSFHLVEGHVCHDPASLSVQGGDGEWVVSVSIGYLAQTARAAGPTVEVALDLLEHAIATGEAHWSLWRGRKPKIGPRGDQEASGDRNGRAGGKKRK